MNRIKKRIIVRFFSIEANNNFWDNFTSTYNANLATENDTRIINLRGKKHFIKTNNEFQHDDTGVFFLSVVRERNTWQVKALGTGAVSGMKLNQGIIGDPYYFFVVPKYKIVALNK